MAQEVNQDLVKSIQDSFTNEGYNYTSGKSVYNDNLPEDVTAEMVKKVSDYTTEFVAAGVQAAGNVALAAMKKDKKMETAQFTIPAGAFGEVECSIARSKEVSLPFAAEGDPKSEVQYGTSTVKVGFRAGRNSGLLGKVRKDIKATAAEMFGHKKA